MEVLYCSWPECPIRTYSSCACSVFVAQDALQYPAEVNVERTWSDATLQKRHTAICFYAIDLSAYGYNSLQGCARIRCALVLPVNFCRPRARMTEYCTTMCQ